MAASILTLALRHGVIQPMKVDVETLIERIATFAGLNMIDVNEKSTQLLQFVKTFDAIYPNLRNLR
jgi:hypothetical protein